MDSKKSPTTKVIIITTILALCICSILLFAVIQNNYIASIDDTGESSFRVPDNPEKLFTIDLAGIWEYYPDEFLYSDSNSHTSEAEPVLIKIPCNFTFNKFGSTSSSGRGTYRTIINNVPDRGENNICIYFFNLSADYNVFVNGEPQHKMLPTPNSHQIYTVNAIGTVEIAIEITGGFHGLNVVPMFGYVRTPMHIGDTFKNFSLILIAMFFVIFAMFLIFFSSSADKETRPIFIFGFMLAITYVFNICWALGVDDKLTTFLPMSSIYPIVLTLEMFLLCVAYWIFFREYRSNELKKICKIEIIATGISWIFLIIAECFIAASILYVLGIIFCAAGIVIWIYTIYKTIIHYKECNILLSLVLLLIICALIINIMQWNMMIWPGAFYVLPGAIGIYLVYCFYKYSQYKQFQLARVEGLLKTEKLITKTQSAYLASQIQPHFLYNTLLTIQNLCKTNPDQASKLIVRFSNYLRHNIDFMNYTDLIPFSKELEHIDNFMYIQMARFRDMLNYEVDIEYKDFDIPPLTIQPIVENAVKYGARNSLTGGTVRLKTWKDASFIHILVSNDTGVPFNPETAQLRSLNNIKERLQTILGATIDIHPGAEQGTDVEIILTERRRANENGNS